MNALRGVFLGLTLGAVVSGMPVLGQIVTNPPGIVSLWAAEEDPSDSASTNHGLIQGTVAYSSGRVGQAFAFDGTGGRIEVPHNTNLGASPEATFMAWVCPDKLPSLHGQFMYVMGRSQPGNDFDLQVETDDCAKIYVLGGLHASSTTLIRTGTWFHLTATYRANDRIEIFLNATKEGSTTIDGAVADNSNPFTIGTSPIWGRPWHGRIDQVRLFNRVLSEKEIRGLYVAEFGVSPKVPLQIRVSQIELCWETVAGMWYQPQYKSDLTTNIWVPLFPGYFRGTGIAFCTNDYVLPGQPEKYYRLLVIDETGGP